MKNLFFLLITCLGLGIYFPIYGQVESTDTVVTKVKPPKSVEYGLNMTALILEFVPLLNRSTGRTGPYAFSYKKFRGDKAFRLGLGAHIDPDEPFNVSEPLNNLNLRIGYERRREISKHWRYSSGVDAMFFLGNLNSPIGNVGGTNGNAAVGGGVGFILGVEYLILPRLSVSTEGAFLLGLSENGPILNFIPPVGVFLNAKIK